MAQTKKSKEKPSPVKEPGKGQSTRAEQSTITIVLIQPIATEKTEAISTLRQHRLNRQPRTLSHCLGGIKEGHVGSEDCHYHIVIMKSPVTVSVGEQ